MSYFSQNETEKAKDMFQRSLNYQPDKVESLRAMERIK
jgi:Tfp pilus assembly protein PilF